MTSAAILTPQEAFFALSRILSWADGIQQEAEIDALTTLRLTERLDVSVYDRIDAVGNDDEMVFDAAIKSLKDTDLDTRARACAWMLMTAMVASVGAVTTGELQTGATLANVSPEEREWITKTQKALGVVEAEMDKAFRRIPRIRHIE